MSVRPYLLAATSLAKTVLALIVVSAGPAPAHAEFRVCNQTLNLFNLAVGRFVGPQLLETEGWWTLTANSCVSLIKEPLETQFIYLYGTDIYGEPAIVGSSEATAMCVAAEKFTITDQKDCWVRGYERVRFVEVDTGVARRWTFFIRD